MLICHVSLLQSKELKNKNYLQGKSLTTLGIITTVLWNISKCCYLTKERKTKKQTITFYPCNNYKSRTITIFYFLKFFYLVII